jgi:flagellar hook-associated protein FlgK
MPLHLDTVSIAKNSLRSNQLEMDICNQNLNEIDTDAPAKKIVTSVSGDGSVRTDVIEMIKEPLLKQTREALVVEKEVSVKLEAFDLLQKSFGKVDDENSIYALGDEIANSFHMLASANSLNFESVKQKTFSTINNFLTTLKSTSQQIQNMRQSAEDEISSSLTEINTCLKAIADFNSKINTQTSGDFSITQQRRDALTKLANYMGFYAQNQSDGTIHIYSDKAGTYSLVDKNQCAVFSYTPQSDISPTTTFGDITLSFAGQPCNGGNDVTSYLAGLLGSLSSQIYLRDTLGPSLQSQLNKAGAFLYTNVNEIHNKGVSSVLRNSIIGEGIPNALTVVGSEALALPDMAGTLTFGLMNSNHCLATVGVGQNSSVSVDLTQFSGYVSSNGLTGTISDFVSFLNSQFTTNNVGITASITNNQLTLTATNTNLGIVIGESSDANIQLSGTTSGRPFSEFFGLNNLFSTTVALNSNDFINHLTIRSDIAANRGSGICTGQLITTRPLPSNQPIIENKSIAETISDALQNDILSFGATSTLGAQQKTFSQYLSLIVVNHSQMTKTIERESKIAKTQRDSLSMKLRESTKYSREEIENMVPRLAIYRQQITQMLQVNFSMESALSNLHFN